MIGGSTSTRFGSGVKSFLAIRIKVSAASFVKRPKKKKDGEGEKMFKMV